MVHFWFMFLNNSWCVNFNDMMEKNILLCLTLGRYRRRRVLSSVIPVGRLSISPSIRLSFPKIRHHSNSLRISAISLTFGGMMHSTMGQITILNGYGRPIVACFTELWNFPWYAFSTRSEGRRYRSNSIRVSGICIKWGWLWSGSLHEIATLG